MVILRSCQHLDAAPMEDPRNSVRNSTLFGEDYGNFTSSSGEGELAAEGNLTDDGLANGQILFEGDIRVSIEKLRNYYDINETMEKELIGNIPGGHVISKRAATSDGSDLWPLKTVPYVISSTFSTNEIRSIFEMQWKLGLMQHAYALLQGLTRVIT